MVAKVVYQSAIRNIFTGWKVQIQGRTTECGDRFDINLECKNPCDKSRITIPLHISVRFNECCIIRNSYTQSGFGKEEKDGGMPLTKGQKFTIELVCKAQVFEIIINGCHFRDYEHRIQFNTINDFNVEGEVEITDVSFSKTPECDDKHCVKPKVYEQTVTSMFVGRLISIDGSTTDCTSSFDIDLVHKSKSSAVSYSIPLHIRFSFVEERVTMNTLADCGWQKEELHHGIPLSKGEAFSIEIECKKNEFRISIGGVRYCDYKHRLPHETITHLKIKGDIPYRQVSFDEVSG